MRVGQPLREHVDAVLQQVAGAPSVFCFLDYDGTLVALAQTPDHAAPPSSIAPLLAQLAAAPGTRVAVVTGRTIADLRRFIDVPGLFYVGIHGLEIQLPNGEMQIRDEVVAMRAALPLIKQQVQHALAARQGILLEDKGAALACHYRLASRADAALAHRVLQDVIEEAQRRGVPVVLMRGHEVTEIRPAGVDKGKAICALLRQHAPDALPIYVGDDFTDEDAFAQLPPAAITVRVGASDQPTQARFRLAEPSDVHGFLNAVLRARTEKVQPTLCSD